MKYKNILVAYDESDLAKAAIGEALDLIEGVPQAKVTVLSAVYDPAFNAAAAQSGIPQGSLVTNERSSQMQQRIQDEVSKIAEGHDGQIEVCATQGKPAKTIVEYAKEKDCDLIVMGCRGVNAMRGMLGSVSNAVLREAHVPVLIVK